MSLVPTDGNEVPDAELTALENHTATPESGSEPSQQTPEPKAEVTQPEVVQEPKIPFNQNPEVQLYIERQVAKRVGEGNKAWEERLARLETNLTKPKVDNKIGGWEPGSDAERQAAKAIILQAKKEMAEELQGLDRAERQKVEGEDKEFNDFLGELRSTEVLKDDKDVYDFAKLIADYKLEDKEAAVNLGNRLQEGIRQAREEGQAEGSEEEKKKAQLAKVGSSRKGGEPGQGERSYTQRRAEEPNFDAIYNREMEKLGL